MSFDKVNCILNLIAEIDKLNFTTEEKVDITDIIHNHYEKQQSKEAHDNFQRVIDSIGVIEYDGITGKLDEVYLKIQEAWQESVNKVLGGLR